MRTLMNFSVTKLADMEEKGNLGYFTHYAVHFDRLVSLYLIGDERKLKKVGRCLFVSPVGRSNLLNYLLSPLRCYKVARACGATHFLTADLVYGWWHSILLRLLIGGRVVSMPVCTPPEIYKNTGATYSGYNILIEKFLIFLTFWSSTRIVVVERSPATRKWLSSSRFRSKVRVITASPEELPPDEFLSVLQHELEHAVSQRYQSGKIKLLYVGRTEAEKLTLDLIDVAELLRARGREFELVVVGDGSVRPQMEAAVSRLGLQDCVIFRGFLPSRLVAHEIAKCDIFLSTLTGTAMKEAAFLGTPIIAYGIDLVPMLFTHDEHCLMTEGRDPEAMADCVEVLIDDPRKARMLGENVRSFAERCWSIEAVETGLDQAFSDL